MPVARLGVRPAAASERLLQSLEALADASFGWTWGKETVRAPCRSRPAAVGVERVW